MFTPSTAITRSLTFWPWVRANYGWISALLIAVFYTIKTFEISLPDDAKKWEVIGYAFQGVFAALVGLGATRAMGGFDSKTLYECSEEELKRAKSLNLFTVDEIRRNVHLEANAVRDMWIEWKRCMNVDMANFTNFWTYAWYAWAVFYGLLWLNASNFELADGTTLKVPVYVLNLANNIGSLMFFRMFLIFSESTSTRNRGYWIKPILLALAIIAGEFIWSLLPDSSYKDYSWVPMLLTGLIAGACLAACISVFNDRYINPPWQILMFLSFYPVIQPLWLFYEEPFAILEHASILKVVSQALAFTLKIGLFLLVTWALRTGRLLYSNIEQSSLNHVKGSSFSEFLSKVEIVDINLWEENKMIKNRR